VSGGGGSGYSRAQVVGWWRSEPAPDLLMAGPGGPSEERGDVTFAQVGRRLGLAPGSQAVRLVSAAARLLPILLCVCLEEQMTMCLVRRSTDDVLQLVRLLAADRPVSSA